MWTIKENDLRDGSGQEVFNPMARFVVFKQGSKSWSHYYAFPTLEEAEEKLASIVERLSAPRRFELAD